MPAMTASTPHALFPKAPILIFPNHIIALKAQSLVDPMTFGNAAQHTQITTTDIYARGPLDGTTKVVRIHGEKTKRNG